MPNRCFSSLLAAALAILCWPLSSLCLAQDEIFDPNAKNDLLIPEDQLNPHQGTSGSGFFGMGGNVGVMEALSGAIQPAATPTPPPAWGNFEEWEGQEAQRKLQESGEYQMQQELHRPIPKSYNDSTRLDDLEESVRSLRGSDKDDSPREEHYDPVQILGE